MSQAIYDKTGRRQPELEVRREGIKQGRARVLNFTGSGIGASAAATGEATVNVQFEAHVVLALSEGTGF